MTTNPLYAPPPDSSPPPLIASQTAAHDAQGRMVAQFTATDPMMVYRITVTSDTQGTAYVYVGPAGVLTNDNLVSGTWSAQFDENDSRNPYYVPLGQTLTVYFVSGGVCTARIEYEQG